MRQITIDKVKSTLSKEIKDLPFGITKRGKIIGIMISPNHRGSNITNPSTTVIQKPNSAIQNNNFLTPGEIERRKRPTILPVPGL